MDGVGLGSEGGCEWWRLLRRENRPLIRHEEEAVPTVLYFDPGASVAGPVDLGEELQSTSAVLDRVVPRHPASLLVARNSSYVHVDGPAQC